MTSNVAALVDLQEIWIAGYPSFYGGADTELFHNILLWHKIGIVVNLVPISSIVDKKMRDTCDGLGCHTHEYKKDIFKDKIVLSFCNGSFLDELGDIVAYGKPKKIIWFNCMTRLFEKEILAHQNDWIDQFGFVSRYQESVLRPQLEKYGEVKKFEGYKPYFDYDSVKFEYRDPGDCFTVGRISRDDGTKYSTDMWKIFDKVCVPKRKKVFVLGFGENARKKCGDPPIGLDCRVCEPCAIDTGEFYRNVNCVIHKTGGSRESYGRFVLECYAYGVVPIVEKAYAFPEIVVDGVTGYTCETSDEMSFRASQLAFNENLRKTMIFNGRMNLEKILCSFEDCVKPWKRLTRRINIEK